MNDLTTALSYGKHGLVSDLYNMITVSKNIAGSMYRGVTNNYLKYIILNALDKHISSREMNN